MRLIKMNYSYTFVREEHQGPNGTVIEGNEFKDKVLKSIDEQYPHVYYQYKIVKKIKENKYYLVVLTDASLELKMDEHMRIYFSKFEEGKTIIDEGEKV